MAIDFKTFSDVVPHVLATKKPVLLRGRHVLESRKWFTQLLMGLSYQSLSAERRFEPVIGREERSAAIGLRPVAMHRARSSA